MNDYPGQMHNGYTFSLLPVLDKIYKDNKEERIKAKKRHMDYFNITPNIAGFALGISTAMEEENAKNPEFDDTTINTVKTSLIGHHQIQISQLIKTVLQGQSLTMLVRQ